MVRTCSTCGETILGAQEAFVCAPKEEYTGAHPNLATQNPSINIYFPR